MVILDEVETTLQEIVEILKSIQDLLPPFQRTCGEALDRSQAMLTAIQALRNVGREQAEGEKVEGEAVGLAALDWEMNAENLGLPGKGGDEPGEISLF